MKINKADIDMTAAIWHAATEMPIEDLKKSVEITIGHIEKFINELREANAKGCVE